MKKRNEIEILYELSISVACLLDDIENVCVEVLKNFGYEFGD